MPLFVVRHSHQGERCPAQDPYMGAMLLNHLSRPNVRRHGVEILGEAVVQGEHTMFLIAEASDENHLREFLQPFQMAGSVDVFPASTCARVVASGGCGAPLPVSEVTPALDPEEICQHAIDAGLLVHRAHPLNCETPLSELVGGVVVPTARFYVRNNFPIPKLDASDFRLRVSGLVDRPLSLSLRDLQNMRSQTEVVTLECAGNGRTSFDPPVPGERWQFGAVEHRGVDRRAAGRDPGSCRRAVRRDRGALPRCRRRRGGQAAGQDQLRAEPLARPGAGVRRGPGLGHERRATPDPARLSAPPRGARAGTAWPR